MGTKILQNTTKLSAQTFNQTQCSKSFASGINFYKLTWIFLIGSIVGYLVEMIWCFSQKGYFESRQGVIYGPFSPIYGYGGILLTLFLYKMRNKNGALLFAISAALGAVFEYVCSLVQEVLLGTISWDYSKSPLNFGGRTNLKYAVFWGVLGLIFIKFAFPLLNSFIEKVPNEFGIWATKIFVVFMVLNIVISAFAIKRQTDRKLGVPATNSIAVFLDEHYPDDFLKVIFPNMKMVQ